MSKRDFLPVPTQLPFMLRPDPDIKQLLGLSRASVYKYLNRADVPSLRIGRRILVPRDAFLDFLEKQIKG